MSVTESKAKRSVNPAENLQKRRKQSCRFLLAQTEEVSVPLAR